LRKPHVSIGISDGRPGNLVLCSMLVDGGAPEEVDGPVTFSCRLRSIPLLPRVYQLWCSVRSEQAYGDLFDWQALGAFRIADSPGLDGVVASTDAPIHIAHEWKVLAK
jgi:hypothetical protein